MKPIAVVLSGCGYLDGSEIHEAVLTLLALDRANVPYECLALDVDQAGVMNHCTQAASEDTRSVLMESARIARGEIKSLASTEAGDYAAAIFPGGFGVATTLSDFAQKGANCTVDPALLAWARGFVEAKKPMGFLCIAPILATPFFGPGVRLTVGGVSEASKAIEAMGGVHVECASADIVVDEAHRVVSTPAYMSASGVAEVALGAERLVEVLARLI